MRINHEETAKHDTNKEEKEFFILIKKGLKNVI